MENFQERLDKIFACTKIGVEEIENAVFDKLEEINPKERCEIKSLEFSLRENKISFFTIKHSPYLYKELLSFKLEAPKNDAAFVFNELCKKLKSDGCKLEDISDSSFKIVV